MHLTNVYDLNGFIITFLYGVLIFFQNAISHYFVIIVLIKSFSGNIGLLFNIHRQISNECDESGISL